MDDETGDSTSIKKVVNSYSSQLASLLPAVAAITTTLGGAILFLYFLKIKYIPPMGLAELALLFTASALIGIFILVWIGLLPLLVNLPWRLMLENETVKRTFSRDDWREQLPVFVVWCSIPVIFVVISAYLIGTSESLSLALRLIIFLPIAIYLLLLVTAKGLSIGQCFMFIAATIFSSFMMFLAIFIWVLFAREALECEDIYGQLRILSFIVFILAVVFTLTIKPPAEFLAKLPESIRPSIWSGVISTAGSALLFSHIGISTFTNVVVKNLGVGGYRSVSIVLDKNGKIALNLLNINCSTTTEQDYCVADDLELLWGRGDEYYFRYFSENNPTENTECNKAEKGLEFSFTLPRKNIISVRSDI